MNSGPLIFLGVLLTFSVSWYGLIVGPVLQLGKQEVAIIEETGGRYPMARPGLAQQGREVYRANGCNYCHTQQTGGVAEWRGTNFVRYAGADMERGWAVRPSVARDYLFDQPVMLGSQRIGQDLANIGTRQTNEAWHLTHLYNPQLVSPGSVMPPYAYLFEKRKIKSQPSPDALQVGSPAAEDGYEIVPKQEARALVAYLMSLQANTFLKEVPPPHKPAAAKTNQPPAAISTNAPTTNASTAGPK